MCSSSKSQMSKAHRNESTMERWSSTSVKTSVVAKVFPSEVAVRNSLYRIQSFWKEKYYLTHSPCGMAPDCQMTFLYWSSLKSHLGYRVLTDLMLKISLCILECRSSLLSGGGEKSLLSHSLIAPR